MKRKIDHFLMTIIMVVLPCWLAIFAIISAITFFVYLDDEFASLWLNLACLIGVIILAIWVYRAIKFGIGWIAEQIHFAKLDKYYKQHPEKERENTEALAKGFEDLAKALRKINEDNVEVKEDKKE